MFSIEFLEKIYQDTEMRTLPVACQSTAIRVFEEHLEEIARSDKYATIQQLLDTDV